MNTETDMTTKTVGENEQEMKDILEEAAEAGQEWALMLMAKHGSADAAFRALQEG